VIMTISPGPCKALFIAIILLGCLTFRLLAEEALPPDGSADIQHIRQLFAEKDYYRTVSEIYKLKFNYHDAVLPRLDLMLLRSQYQLQDYNKVQKTAKSLLSRPDQTADPSYRCQLGRYLTASLIQSGKNNLARESWNETCYSLEQDPFPGPETIPDPVDPNKARFYSSLLPGSGLLLSGEYGKAAVSFLLNVVFISGIYRYGSDHQWGIAGVLTFFELGWYFGGREAAYESAERRNRKQLMDIQRSWISHKLSQ